MRILLGLILAGLFTSTASGQAYQPGIYDGRAINGWSYSEQGSQAAGLPSWYPTDGSASGDGANCNVGHSRINGTRADWLTYFTDVTPASFAEQLAASGTQGARGYLTDVMEMHNRPVMRNLLTAHAAGQQLEFMIVSISGADGLVTVTCTAMSGRLLERADLFDRFVNELVVSTAPPR